MEEKKKSCCKGEVNHRAVAARRMKRTAFFVMMLFMLAAAVPAGAAAEETQRKEGWQFDADVYMWMPDLGAKTPQGDDIKISFDDLLKDLELAFMGGVAARNGRWSLMMDVLYMKLKQQNDKQVTASVGPEGHEIDIAVDATVKLLAWVLTPAVGYTIFDNGKFRFDIIAGARYLWIKPELVLDVTGPLQPREKKISDSGDVWDGIVGIRGNVNLNDKWYVPYYVDMGTGDSAFTTQGMAGFGYKISKVLDVVAAYRYLYWKFEDNKVLDKLHINGPLVGLRYRF